MRDGVSALTLNFWEKLRTKELFQQRSTLKGKNEKVVEIGIREAKSTIFCQAIVIHKKEKAMSKNALLKSKQQIDCGGPAIC